MTDSSILFTDAGQVVQYAWPGGYPIYYLVEDCSVLCPACVQCELVDTPVDVDPDDPQWNVIAHAVNWEDSSLFCDHCSKQIEAAYEAAVLDDQASQGESEVRAERINDRVMSGFCLGGPDREGK